MTERSLHKSAKRIYFIAPQFAQEITKSTLRDAECFLKFRHKVEIISSRTEVHDVQP